MTRSPVVPRLLLLPGLACDTRLWQAQLDALPADLHPKVTDVHTRASRIEDMAALIMPAGIATETSAPYRQKAVKIIEA